MSVSSSATFSFEAIPLPAGSLREVRPLGTRGLDRRWRERLASCNRWRQQDAALMLQRAETPSSLSLESTLQLSAVPPAERSAASRSVASSPRSARSVGSSSYSSDSSGSQLSTH